MADGLPIGLGAIYSLATGGTIGGWLTMGITFIASTIIGAIVLILILKTFGKAWHESIPVSRAFFVIIVINLITQLGVVGLITGFIPAIAMASIIVNLLLWIGMIKLFFSGMKITHAAIIGVVGYIVNLIIVPMLVGMVMGFIPAF